jgi:hypothetical protein
LFWVFQAAIEAIQRWSELHQKQQEQDTTTTPTRDEHVYLSIVSKACYDVFDYPQGWLIDSTVFPILKSNLILKFNYF